MPRPSATPALWLACQRYYQQEAGSISVADAAKKFGLSISAANKRAVRNGWVASLANGLKTSVEQRVRNHVSSQVSRLSDRAEKLVERTLSETEGWLEDLQKQRAKGVKLEPEQLRTLIAGWRDVIQVGRTAHGLDTPGIQLHEHRHLHAAVVGELEQLQQAKLPPVGTDVEQS